MKTQKEAVYSAVMGVLSEQGIEFTEGQIVENLFTSEMRSTLSETIKTGFKAGEVSLDQTPANQAKLADDAKLSAYVSGLISNWFRKDKRLNGNVTYVAKNPGSRAGSGDPQLKALRQLLKQVAGSADETRVQAAIEKRLAVIKPAGKVEIDMNALPEEFHDLIEQE